MQIKRIIAICDDNGVECEMPIYALSSICKSLKFGTICQPASPATDMKPLYGLSIEIASTDEISLDLDKEDA